jgi:hypothetical protein
VHELDDPGGAAFEFINPVGDENPPICEPDSIEGAGGPGSATDNRPSEDGNANGVLDAGEDLNGNDEIDVDTGIFDVRRAPGAFNLSLTVDPFVPADPIATFSVAQTNPLFPAIGLVRAIDGAGNSCTVLAKLGSFDPFTGFSSVPVPFVSFPLTIPSPDTTGARCVETTDADCANDSETPEDCMPDFGDIPYEEFTDGSLEYDVDLSDGDGTKIVCCEFVNANQEASPPLCDEIVLDTDGGCVPTEESDAAMTCSDGIDNDCDGDTDVDDADCEPLLVVLDSFTARRTSRGVLLEWTTVSEIDNAGFRIVATDADGAGQRAVTPSWVAAQGTELSGARYEFLDPTRIRTGTVYYWLEDIDVYGRVTRHGPAVVSFGRPGRTVPGEPGERANGRRE